MDSKEILNYWFGSNPDDVAVAEEKSALWWSKKAATDEDIRKRFTDLLAMAATGKLSTWQATPSGRLALILLTDQFPRCIHRDSPLAFVYDRQARDWCLDGIERSFDRELRPIERVFFYLPLEHSESLAHQERSVELFHRLAASAGGKHRKLFDEYLRFAVRHRDIIARFGRFPHRNQTLGRVPTAEEVGFLGEPESSF